MAEDKVRNTIYMKAQDYLSRRGYGTSELSQKLLKKYPEEADRIRSVMEECERLGYLNDRLFTENYIRAKLKYKQKSLRNIQLELSRKSLSEIATNIISHTPELLELEREALKNALEKKIRQTKNFSTTDREMIQKIKASLYRKGFSLTSIEEILNTM